MRLIAFIVAFVAATALLLGVIALFVVDLPRAGTGSIVLGFVAAPFSAYGPLLLGCLTASEDARSSSPTGTAIRRWSAVILGVQIAAAISIVLAATLAGSGPVVPLVFLVGGALLTLVAWRVGPALRRHDALHRPADDPWVPIDRRQLRLRIVAVAAAFAGGFVFVELVSLLVQLSIDHRLAVDATDLAFDFEAAFFGAAVVSAISTSRWQRLLRVISGPGFGQARFLTRVALKGAPVPLTPADAIRASAYAQIGWVVMSFQTGYLTFFYCAIILNQAGSLSLGTRPTFSLVLLALFVAVVIAFLPVQLVRIRRTYRYAREHADVARAFVATRRRIEPSVGGSTCLTPPA